MSHKGDKAADKRDQFWSSISKEKLDALRWVLLHSGLNVAGLQSPDGLTGIQVAASGDKPKALLVILDILRQKRELAEAVDVRTDDARGATALHLACARGADKCAEHLIYYGASLTAKSGEGLTARDYAARGKHTAIMDMIDEELGVGAYAPAVLAAAAAADVGAADADGLTSTQRSRLKKKQLREAANRGVLAAAAATEGEGADDEASSGAGAGDAGAAVPVLGPGGPLPPLPAKSPEPIWPELRTALAEKRRELSWAPPAEVAGADGGEPGPAAAAAPALPAGVRIDPALWHATLINRLELRVPGLGALPAQLGHLSALQTLIVSRCDLVELPAALGALQELKFVDASHNSLTSLPEALGRLPKLEMLDISHNKLVSLAPLATSTALVRLLADSNELVDVSPLNWAGLSRLETLSLSHNRLAELPDAIGELANLANLNVAANALTELPAGLADLKEKKIKELSLMPNPFADKKVRLRFGARCAPSCISQLCARLRLQAARASHPPHPPSHSTVCLYVTTRA